MQASPNDDVDFDTAEEFIEAVRPHFDPLAQELRFEGPIVDTDSGVLIAIHYEGPATSLLLSWDVRERLFGCHIARSHALQDDRDWLSPNEVLAVRGARDRWVTVDDVNDVDASTFAESMAGEAANLRDYCLDVLAGDWSIKPEVQRSHAGSSC